MKYKKQRKILRLEIAEQLKGFSWINELSFRKRLAFAWRVITKKADQIKKGV